MRIAIALFKGLLIVILVLGIVLIVSRFIEVPKTHLAAMTHHKSEPLNNHNLVDALTQHIDTTSLKSIKIVLGKLEVDVMLKQDLPAHEQLYNLVPMYIALAFNYGSNIDELSIRVWREEGKINKPLQLMKLTVNKDDAWLEQGIEILDEVNWLDDKRWNQRLRIQKTIFWQLQYEI